MSLGFGEVTSVLGLCADAVILISGRQPVASGAYYGLRDLKGVQGRLAELPVIQDWVDQLIAHPDRALLKE